MRLVSIREAPDRRVGGPSAGSALNSSKQELQNSIKLHLVDDRIKFK